MFGVYLNTVILIHVLTTDVRIEISHKIFKGFDEDQIQYSIMSCNCKLEVEGMLP